ncbi:GIY-YIG catalytic domain-containing protein [Bacillus sp. OV166]|uniref:GIY-YIG nuclease family protein n=1 Tax=Bacillus sp. OV166 TaxID=1882763 RepID=UPI000A2AEC65|nr:GIY-YIG nuclease family protein [Bacillus sp. OV166]SMQ78366.1 GIY-YIG catalytic domain-containing protein [Bacillus sp. OV166]
MNQSYLEENWSGLNWTPWYSFRKIMETKSLLPTSPGMYRIKPVSHHHFMYIGQTGRNLRERLTDLIRNTLKEEMPFNDPHTAAPSLWAWKDATGWEFELSVSTIELPKEEREGLESFLLWDYRVQSKESTYCNYGRFHQDYIKSKNRSSKFRGRKLFDSEQRNPAWGISSEPLSFHGTPTSSTFMGLEWSEFIEVEKLSQIPNKEGVYRVIGLDTNTLLYIGQSQYLRNRLRDHAKKDWGQKIAFSYSLIEDAKDYLLKELENDLIGAYFSINQTVPIFQVKNLKNNLRSFDNTAMSLGD